VSFFDRNTSTCCEYMRAPGASALPPVLHFVRKWMFGEHEHVRATRGAANARLASCCTAVAGAAAAGRWPAKDAWDPAHFDPGLMF